MPKFEHLGSKFSKTNVRLEISIFEIEYIQNFVKIRKLILLGAKYQKLGIWAQHIWKQLSDLKSAPSKSRFPQFWNFGSLWVVLGLSAIFFGSLQVVSGCFSSFRLVLGCLGSFCVLVSTLFWCDENQVSSIFCPCFLSLSCRIRYDLRHGNNYLP